MFPARTPGNGRSAPIPRGDPSPTPPPARRRTLNAPPPGSPAVHPGSPAAFRHPPAQSRLTEHPLSGVPCSLFHLCAAACPRVANIRGVAAIVATGSRCARAPHSCRLQTVGLEVGARARRHSRSSPRAPRRRRSPECPRMRRPTPGARSAFPLAAPFQPGQEPVQDSFNEHAPGSS